MHLKEEVFDKFPELEIQVQDKLFLYADILKSINARVNLISRKDEDDIAYRHIAFCLSITRFLKPNDNAKILDVGCGGGLPGIVMAIVWQNCKIFMFDGVGKKIFAVQEMIKILGLKNAVAKKARVEETKEKFDYITGRSVCALPQFFKFVKKSIRDGKSGNFENGVVYFKGGELEEELVKNKIFPNNEMKLDEFFEDSNYEGKKLVHFSLKNILKLKNL